MPERFDDSKDEVVKLEYFILVVFQFRKCFAIYFFYLLDKAIDNLRFLLLVNVLLEDVIINQFHCMMCTLNYKFLTLWLERIGYQLTLEFLRSL